jgi:TatD DNase family protein
MSFIDFHCHLDFKEYDGVREQIVKECFETGFSRIVTVADPYEEGSFERTVETLQCHRNVSCMTAAHPHNADLYSPQIEKNIVSFIETNRAVGFGEAGLDFYYNLSTPENQRSVFKRQIAIADELALPLVIHSRNAESEVLNTLETARFQRPVVFHCYTGSKEDAQEILKRGYYISISGIVTFKKADFLREIAQMVPLDRIFTETDSPYLSPVPFRGKTNTPLRVVQVAEKVAEVKGITVEELNRAVNENFLTLIGEESIN